MNSFNVLSRSTQIHRSYLLEASAGTGKTYSIENIIARMVLEEDPNLPIADAISIEKILVVTFTRAATRDLRERVRSSLQKALADLKSANMDGPDYLCAILEKGEQSVKQGIKRLENALFAFDQAQIFTIHAFCSRMLHDYGFEAGILFDTAEGQLTDTQILRTIRDFFRTGLHSQAYSPEQLHIVLKDHNKQMEKLEKKLLDQIKRGYKVIEIDDFSKNLKAFNAIMRKLAEDFQLSGWKICEDFENQMDFYTKIGDKEEARAKIRAFAALFDKGSWDVSDLDLLLRDGIYFLEALNPENLRKIKIPSHKPTLHCPGLAAHLSMELHPFIEEISNPNRILARMVYDCREMVLHYASEEELLRYDDILSLMEKALRHPSFAEKVREKYQAAVIDEFQDTDPTQWKIFEALFLKNPSAHRYLYLVGDPKQSIYAFRQADIYTYLSAAQAIGEDNRASLDKNFRSTPSLVHALNSLFKRISRFMPLPRTESYLDYPEVKASDRIKQRAFGDHLGAVHFCLVNGLDENGKALPPNTIEEKFLFPFIAEEIVRLHETQKIPFSSFAILVKDSWQSYRLVSCLKEWGIPVSVQKQANLTDCPALPAIKEALQAFLNPKDESALKLALGGPLFGWTHSDIKHLKDPSELEKVLTRIYRLRAIFLEKGFGPFFIAFFQTEWILKKTVAENLLAREEGEQFYHDCMQIAELLIEHQASISASFEGLILYLDEFKKLAFDGEERIKKKMDAAQNAIHILTLHYSKGLEYDIVFPLGLCRKLSKVDPLVPVYRNGEFVIAPAAQSDPASFESYCDECDAEKMRQLYVGMTRARERLYIPAIFSPSKKQIERGTASPMDLFAVRFVKDMESSQHIYNEIQTNTGVEFCQLLDQVRLNADVSYKWLNGQEFNIRNVLKKEAEAELAAPEHYAVPGKPMFIHSYTGLAHLSKKKEKKNLDGSHENSPKEFASEVCDRHTLPSGKQTGILLHEILENIPLRDAFKAGSSEEFSSWARPYLKNTPYEKWENVFCSIVYDALQIKIGNFSLKQIEPQYCLREMEFLYPSTGISALEGFSLENGFLKGAIDLLCEFQGKYYIIDWKSNWLGPSCEDYQQTNLQQAIVENQYDLQAKIYREALKKYLKIFNCNFNACFGGIYYIFLRGLDPLRPQNGVIFIP